MSNDDESLKKESRPVDRREDAATVLAVGISGLLGYGVYEATRSLQLTMLAALVCGIACVALVPVRTGAIVSGLDKRTWLLWFIPALLVEAAILGYILLTATPRTEVLGWSGLAWIFGATAAGTYKVLNWSES
jgi:hypothetical protein